MATELETSEQSLGKIRGKLNLRNMRMKMDDKQAALIVHILWAWLERNPGHDKIEYPLYFDLHIGHLYLQCPWCELYRDWHDRKCMGCCPLERVNQGCYKPGSWYDYWDDKITYQQGCSVEAGNIASLAWKEYKRLGG